MHVHININTTIVQHSIKLQAIHINLHSWNVFSRKGICGVTDEQASLSHSSVNIFNNHIIPLQSIQPCQSIIYILIKSLTCDSREIKYIQLYKANLSQTNVKRSIPVCAWQYIHIKVTITQYELVSRTQNTLSSQIHDVSMMLSMTMYKTFDRYSWLICLSSSLYVDITLCVHACRLNTYPLFTTACHSFDIISCLHFNEITSILFM